ncbi:hypothetical protein WMF18_12270 [Sorangium sp. So ce315]|uniref:hypothetical protein n=1 Tax=Sorangium sp. So ce315 TaxID=3133299 RepID=UPI003F62B4D8
MTRSNRAALAFIFTSALLGNTGCTSQDRPIGAVDPGQDGEGSSAAALLIARWEGYVENFKFRSGSDVIQIDIESVEGESIQGKVRFGAGPSLAPPTDGDVGYPPSSDPLPEYDIGLPYEAFDFTILGAQLTDRRLRFSIDPRELWTGWCELQTSYPMSPGSDAYKCMPNTSIKWGSDGCELDGQPVDCGYMNLCRYWVCDCQASGCTVDARGGIDFDFAVDQQEANGSMAHETRMFNVRLTRDP